MTVNLPTGWIQASIGDVCRSVDKTDPRDSPDMSFEYIDIGGIQSESGRIRETKTLMGVDAPSRARQKVRAGDVVLSTVRTYQRKTAIVPSELDGAIASTGFAVLRTHPGIDPRFMLFQALGQEVVDQLNAMQTGTSYPAVRDKDVRSASIRIAPSPEQERIVAASKNTSPASTLPVMRSLLHKPGSKPCVAACSPKPSQADSCHKTPTTNPHQSC